jgi:signal peptide peptidase SppA
MRAEASETSENPSFNRLLSVVDDVAIISIHGSLTNTEAWYNEYYGLIAYSEIVDALYQAALDPNIKEVLLDVASGGGAVNGVLDAVSAVERTAKVKKVTAFTSSVMCSAAYWLVAPAHERYASAVATVGSIGVVIKHVEYSKMAEKEGVKETIIRSGEFKQISNASEPLSEKAEADLQEKSDYIYGIFVDSVATHLNSTYQIVDTKMADGKEFIGQQAVDVGLVDAVASFEDVFGGIQSRITKNGGQEMKKRYLGAAALAAAAAGIASEAEVTTPETGATAPEVTADGTPEVPEAPAPEPEAADAGTVAYLSAQLKEKDDALLAAKVEAAGLAKQVEAIAGLKVALAGVVNNMTVALGGSKDEKLAESDPVALLAVFNATMSRTVEAFKVGGIAASREETETEAPPMKSRLEKALESTTLKK